MKRVVLIITMIVGAMSTFAQSNVEHIYITDLPSSIETCFDNGTTYYIYAEDNCDFFIFHRNEMVFECISPIIIDQSNGYNITITYDGCNFSHTFSIKYSRSLPSAFTKTVWKLKDETVGLSAVEIDSVDYYHYKWIHGTDTISTNPMIYVDEPDAYDCIIYNGCGLTTRTFVFRDKVELYRATVDLETNLNKATWQTTPEQAEYISEVNVYRDGLLVGTAPYEQGYFLDNIGSDNAARNYHLVAVTTEGEESPVSYQKGTIHTTYYEDVNSNLNMTWNIPYVEEGANGTLTYFQICKYDPSTGDLTVVDQVNAAITDYTCGVNQFDGGYAVIAAVFNDGKGVEELSFSNLTTEILGIEEDGPSTGSGTFTVYPNPVKDCVTIEGTGKAIITNALGQTILTKEIDGKETVEFPQGLYFVKMNGVTRKIVVE